jgi:WD40 repeat protein
VIFSADGKFLYTATLAGTVIQWDCATGAPIDPPMQTGKPIASMAINSRGDLLALGRDMSDSHANLRAAGLELEGFAEIELWNIKNRKLLRTLALHTNTVTSLSFTTDDKRLASTGLDKRLHLWGLQLASDNDRRRSSR